MDVNKYNRRKVSPGYLEKSRNYCTFLFMSYVNKLAYYRVLIDAYNAQQTSKLPFNTKSRRKFCTFMTFQSVKKIVS